MVMGVVRTVLDIVRPPSSSTDLRARQSASVAEAAEHEAAWAADESPQRWRLVEDARQRAAQFGVRAGVAEKREAAERDAQAKLALEERRRELDVVVARLGEMPKLIDDAATAACERFVASVAVAKGLADRADAHRRDIRMAEALAKSLGVELPPDLMLDIGMAQIIRFAQRRNSGWVRENNPDRRLVEFASAMASPLAPSVALSE